MAVSEYIAVAGGVNIDVGGHSVSPLITGDSNPGIITTSLGGVGRNIAHNLALLGVPVRLLTALGGDDAAQRIRESCRALGIGLAGSLTVPERTTSGYLYIEGPDGDMVLALSDMSIYELMTPAYFSSVMDVLNGAALVILDANLPAESIDHIAASCTAPLLADPVSVSKAARLRTSLGRLHTLGPNLLEAEALAGFPVTDDAGLYRAADALLETGLRRVFITLGARGVLAAEGSERVLLPNPPQHMVNASGCGDAFNAALAWAFLRGESLRGAAACGLAAAAIAMESAETVNPAMSEEQIMTRLEKI